MVVVVIVAFLSNPGAPLTFDSFTDDSEHQEMCQEWFDEMDLRAANLKGRSESFLGELDLAGEISLDRDLDPGPLPYQGNALPG